MSKTTKDFSAKRLRIIRFGGVLFFIGSFIFALIYTGNDRFLKRCLANGNSVKYCNSIYKDRKLAFKEKGTIKEKRKNKELEIAEKKRKELEIAKNKRKELKIAASEEDLFLYRQIGASYICIASKAEVDFNKGLGIASATFANIIIGKHGGAIKELGNEKLDEKKIYNAATFQLVGSALKICPESIPKNIKNEYEKRLKQL